MVEPIAHSTDEPGEDEGEPDGYGGRTGDRQAQRGQVHALEIRMGEKRRSQGRRTGWHSELVGCDAGQRFACVKDGAGKYGSPARESGEPSCFVAERMKRRD